MFQGKHNSSFCYPPRERKTHRNTRFHLIKPLGISRVLGRHSCRLARLAGRSGACEGTAIRSRSQQKDSQSQACESSVRPCSRRRSLVWQRQAVSSSCGERADVNKAVPPALSSSFHVRRGETPDRWELPRFAPREQVVWNGGCHVLSRGILGVSTHKHEPALPCPALPGML